MVEDEISCQQREKQCPKEAGKNAAERGTGGLEALTAETTRMDKGGGVRVERHPEATSSTALPVVSDSPAGNSRQ